MRRIYEEELRVPGGRLTESDLKAELDKFKCETILICIEQQTKK